MQVLVGIVRTEGELRKALDQIAVLKRRLGRVHVSGGRGFNPAWHLVLDLHSMLSVSEATTLGALERKESRGGHSRADGSATREMLKNCYVATAVQSSSEPVVRHCSSNVGSTQWRTTGRVLNASPTTSFNAPLTFILEASVCGGMSGDGG